KVWEASGHVGGFADPMVDCKACKTRFRADQLLAMEFARDIFKDTQEGPAQFYLSGVGTKDEFLAQNQKAIEKFRKASKGFSVETIRRFTELPAAARSVVPCPDCQQKGHLTEPRQFNLMFKTHVGALEDASA